MADEEGNVEIDRQNGVRRPKKGTKTGRIWEICDELNKGGGITRALVAERATSEGLAKSTATIQFQKWREYMGLVEKKTA